MPKTVDRQYNLLLDDLASLEEYVHDLFSFSPLPICFVSPIGVVLEMNPALEKMTGWGTDEIVGEPLEKFFAKEEVAPLVQDTLRAGFVEGRELKLMTKSNSTILVRISSRLRRDEKGETVGYFLSFFDLTDIKKTEGELKRIQVALLNILEDTEEARQRAETEKNTTQAIITSFSDSLFLFDRQQTLVLMNPQAEKFFGVAQDQVLGRSLGQLAERPELVSLVSFLGEKIAPVSRKEFYLSDNFVLEVSVIPTLASAQNSGQLVVLHDVSREKTIERLKSEFVSLAAHQLRTPLSAIKWSLRLLLDGDLGKVTKDQKEILKKAYESNERMISLINDLLSLSRIEEGKYLLRPVPLDLAKVCQEAVEALREHFRRKKIHLSFTAARGRWSVLGEEEKLKLAIQNLLDNALKYTEKDGRVSLSLKRAKKNIRVEVQDNGIGINPIEQNRVFSKFFRAKEAVLAEPSGTGLGLYMVKNIIESHRGQIGFESVPGRGTTFFFTLPTLDPGQS